MTSRILFCIGIIVAGVPALSSAAEEPDPSQPISPSTGAGQGDVGVDSDPVDPISGDEDADSDERERARQERVQRHLDEADRLRADRLADPDKPGAKESGKLEALNLLYAAWLGDTTQDERRGELVEAVRRDEDIPVVERSKVAAYAGNLVVLRQKHLGRDDRLAAYEKVVRSLIAEFPTVAVGYESLWRIAQARSPETARVVAGELADEPAAPEFVRDEARELLATGAPPPEDRKPDAGEPRS